ncbi:hypothetical protein [Halococcus sediminicola]|uniref:hypothetical protein n=1 Tax=Halococcus sediminicola TaxID=1264579 RepID=UPI000679E54A|nr:hypothetical protein [Halococcus sediminicola]
MKFYDRTVSGYIRVKASSTHSTLTTKATYSLGFRLYEKDTQRRVELAIELADELIEMGIPTDTYLFDTSYCSKEFATHFETYGKECVSAVKSTHV